MGPRLYLNIETDLTASLVPEDLVQMYASSGARRLLYELILCCVYVCIDGLVLMINMNRCFLVNNTT